MPILTKVDEQFGFVSRFNPKNGAYIRSNVYIDGKDSGKDPFMASMPELLDIGIMGSCDHAAQCRVGCYQSGSTVREPNMSFQDYKMLIDQCRGSVFQVALGGRGDPNKHPEFEQILEYSRKSQIVPNYTTSGWMLTDKEIYLTRRYCGAVAVSWYRQDYTDTAIRRFIEAGCRTNVHFVLSRDSIDEAFELVTSPDKFPVLTGINAVVFLLHKPVGQGSRNAMLSPDDIRVQKLFRKTATRLPFKIGFDSCTVPALLTKTRVNPVMLDSCEGARFSAYISAGLEMTPCSFDRISQYSVDLRSCSIRDAWNSQAFERFRKPFRTACPDCRTREHCMGGCPLMPDIVLCNDEVRTDASTM